MTRLAIALLLATIAQPALAQSKSQSPEARIDRIEKELKAVQRKVFPGGDPAFFEPEIAAAPTNAAAGQPAGTPISDLSARVDGIEQELTRLTAQVEQTEHRLTILSEQAAKDRTDLDARLKALEPAAPTLATAVPIEAPAVRPGPAGRPKPAEAVPVIKDAPLPKPAPAKPTAKPAAKPVDAVPPPTETSDDPGEAAYMAGYNLWTAKKYPEAEAALRQVVAKYPKHKRASYAQNLLGRALLDEGRPANAAKEFATNYQANPRGERAPDSLYYLGVALTRLNKNPDACKVYAEFEAAYGTTAEAGLKDKVAAGRKAAQCK